MKTTVDWLKFRTTANPYKTLDAVLPAFGSVADLLALGEPEKGKDGWLHRRSVILAGDQKLASIDYGGESQRGWARFDMPGTDRSFAGRTDARPPVADGKIHTGTSDRRGKICGKVIPPYGNHPATRGGVQWKMQTDTIKGKDAPSPFPIQKIYSSTLPALFPQAVSGATGPIHRCLQRS